MRRVSQYCWVFVLLSGCALFEGNDHLSEWNVLDQAESMDCHVFPSPNGVLRIRDIHVFEGQKTGMLAEVILRTGQRARYYTQFSSDPEVDADQMVKRDFGNGSLVLGGAGMSKGSYVALLQRKEGKSTFELRTLPDNIVRFASPAMSINPVAGDVYFTKYGVWLAYSKGADDRAPEDAEVGVVFLKFGSKGKLIPRHFAKVTIPARARLLVEPGQRKALMVWGEPGKTDKEFKFRMTELDASNLRVEDAKSVDLPVTSEVESWAATPFPDGMLIAYVDGDSLVGQAKVRFSRVYWRGEYTKVAWKKEDALTNIHVSEPVWLRVGARAKLLMPKWVDGESTVATYTVNGQGSVQTAVAGIFPKGSRVMTGFRDTGENDNYSIIRYRHKGAWQFEVCNMEDI